MKNIGTPVLFITFARPDYARKSFDAIKRAKPKNLYFYNNFGRPDKPDEVIRNRQVRALIKEIDWDCNLKTFFREEYVDIYTSLFSAIDWIFENEEQAIILEEDCVASISFFHYCEEVLEKYKHDSRVWIISGDNFKPLSVSSRNEKPDYYFTKYPHIYGWASWRDRWKKLDRTMLTWPKVKELGLFGQYFENEAEAKRWEVVYEKQYNAITEKQIWDYLFEYSRIINNAFGVVPKLNLVSNIGVSGAHNPKGKSARSHNYPTYEFDLTKQIKGPDFVYVDMEFDIQHYKIHISPKFKKSIKRHISDWIKIIFGESIHNLIKQKI